MMSLSAHISRGEILTSGQLAKRLTRTALTPDAARQVISRSRDPAIWILPLRLPRRSRLFTRRDSVQNDEFYHHLATVLREHRPGLARTILALLKRRVLLKADAQRLLAAPLRPRPSRTPTYEAAVATLFSLRFCQVEGMDTALERLTVNPLVGSPTSHQLARSERTRQTIDTRLTRIIVDQFRKQAIISWNGHAVADLETGTVPFSDYVFSAFGYSWLDPLVRRAAGKKSKSTPVLFDVSARECDVHDVEGFLHRLAHIGSNRNARMPVLGVIAAYAFADGAWTVAKRRGLLAINLRQSYGEAALATLAKMEDLLRLAGARGLFGEQAAAIDYDSMADDVAALRTHPYVTELRSLGFEILAAVLLRARGWEDVRVGLAVPFKNTKRDIDVIGKRGGEDEICLVECKAAQETKELDPADVHKFFTETVPAALKSHTNVTKCQAELWTTGRIGQRAKAELAKLSLSKRVETKLREKSDIISLVPPTLSRCKRLIETLSLPN